jgi:hypothetical protein
MLCGRHCREGEGSKIEIVWTRNKKRHYGMKRSEVVGCRHCREGGELRWYGHVIRRDEGKLVRNIME